MGKKKSKKTKVDLEEDEDTLSEPGSMGFGSVGDDDADDEEGPVETFGELVDDHLSSKKSAERIIAMKQIKSCLCSRPDLHTVLDKFGLTLVMNISRCVRNGKPEEALLGLQVAAVSALFFAEENVECIKDIAVLAIYMMKNSHSTVNEVVEAIRALAMCHIADPYLDLEDDTVPDLLKETWTGKYPPNVIAEALSAWTLCNTRPKASKTPLYENAQKILNMVKSTDSHDVCCAGLETLGLVYELSYEDSGKPPPGMGRVDIDEVLQDIVSDGNKTMSKALRKDKKELARWVMGSVSNTETPTERMTFKGKTLDFEGWPKSIQLTALRVILKTGLPAYIASNEPVRKFFEITHIVVQGKAMSKSEKRAMAKSSSERSKEKTIKDHKKSAASLQARYNAEDF
eukprot:TRINITY_DN1721_c1_g1_i1.p1 TRINITY_DN1721_c1_g1~~TRINITY_DN1721_c1_g1_i1.p1  ORF type:complete len:401 (+),score=89.33 TRINITY_DN1721_c1_g1_i1:42-1244(+)